jgi:hypothetical protein
MVIFEVTETIARDFSKFEIIIAFSAFFDKNIHSSFVAFQKVLMDTIALTEPGDASRREW